MHTMLTRDKNVNDKLLALLWNGNRNRPLEVKTETARKKINGLCIYTSAENNHFGNNYFLSNTSSSTKYNKTAN